MDKIWDRKILRSLRSLAVVAGMKKRMTTQNRQKSNAKKRRKTRTHLVKLLNESCKCELCIIVYLEQVLTVVTDIPG